MRGLFFIALILCLVLTGCADKDSGSGQVGIIGEAMPVTRAEAAKMLALAKYSRDEINSLERKISFKDCDEESWYDKYVNAAYIAGLISGIDKDSYKPEEALTIEQAQWIIDKLNSSHVLQLKYSEDDGDKPIPYSVWVEAVERCCKRNNFPLVARSILIYATDRQCKELGKDYILCNGGLMSCEGIDISDYEDETCFVLVRDNEIAAVKSVVTDEPELKDAEIVEVSGNRIGVKLNGGIRYFEADSRELGESVSIVFNKLRGYIVQ